MEFNEIGASGALESIVPQTTVIKPGAALTGCHRSTPPEFLPLVLAMEPPRLLRLLSFESTT